MSELESAARELRDKVIGCTDEGKHAEAIVAILAYGQQQTASERARAESLDAENNELGGQIDELQEQQQAANAARQQAELAAIRLREALEEFGSHHSWCAYPRFMPECNCGYSAALAAAASVPSGRLYTEAELQAAVEKENRACERLVMQYGCDEVGEETAEAIAARRPQAEGGKGEGK